MDFLLEFFINVWIEFAVKLVPADRRHSKRAILVCKLITVLLILYVTIAFFTGAVILSDKDASRALGIVLLSSSLLILVCQTVLGMIFYKKRK